MNKSKLALGIVASILTFSSIHIFAEDSTPASDENQSQELFIEHVVSVVGTPVYQNDETGVTVYSAPESSKIQINK
ncbi:hypothetical protein [Pseudomonas coronafaciens]|uniref:hypothetical protein n=1 Tax=Pseudomonas coronafaciens TaxID=53409 RepID=UPI0011C35BA5|nr:hypothetical protein [Pseudomonas coronafaciens]